MTVESEFFRPTRTTPMRSWPALSALTLLVLMAVYAVFNLTQSVPADTGDAALTRDSRIPTAIAATVNRIKTQLQTTGSSSVDAAAIALRLRQIRDNLADFGTPGRVESTALLQRKLENDVAQIEKLINVSTARSAAAPPTSSDVLKILDEMLVSLNHEMSVRAVHRQTRALAARQRSAKLQEYGRWALLLLGLLGVGLVALAIQQVLAFRRHPAQASVQHDHVKRAIEGLPDGCVVLNSQRQVTAHNSSLEKLLPDSSGDIEGADAESLYSRICHDSTQIRHDLADWLTNLQADSTSSIEVLDHRSRHLLIRERPTQNGEVTAIIRDISDSKEAQHKLQQATDFDALTGLPNRALFMRRLRTYTRETDQSVALIVCDLRDFRQINDSYGQHTGDQLLIAIAQCLRETMPERATIARISGDEFAVVLYPVQERKEVEAATQAFLDRLQQGLNAEHHLLPVRASVGISYGPEHGISPVELKNTADSACAQAKRNGHNGFAIFDRQQQAFANRDHSIDVGLLQALKNDEFQIEYQPQIDIRTNLTSGMEALIRWHSDTLGRVSPAEFIPRAEKSGLIIELGNWVLRKAIEDYQQLTGVGMSPGVLSVNLSRKQFDNPDLLQTIEETLATTGMKPSLLTLEITETAILENRGRAEEVLHSLSALGINLSIDDFGVGYSSFLELRDFPVNEVKIDRMFVKDVVECQNNRKIIQAIVSVAGAIGAEVVAEGIETREQFDCVRALGCDRAQGFFLCEPMTATTFPDVVLGGGSNHDIAV